MHVKLTRTYCTYKATISGQKPYISMPTSPFIEINQQSSRWVSITNGSPNWFGRFIKTWRKENRSLEYMWVMWHYSFPCSRCPLQCGHIYIRKYPSKLKKKDVLGRYRATRTRKRVSKTFYNYSNLRERRFERGSAWSEDRAAVEAGGSSRTIMRLI